MSETKKQFGLGRCERTGCNKRAVMLIHTRRDGPVAVCKDHAPEPAPEREEGSR